MKSISTLFFLFYSALLFSQSIRNDLFNPVDCPRDQYIEISGGFQRYGSNPIYTQFTRIDRSGRLVREVKKLDGTLYRTRKQLSQIQLENLIEWAFIRGFNQLQSHYQGDFAYEDRGKYVPLVISIKRGSTLKRIEVLVYDKGRPNANGAPSIVNELVTVVNNMANEF